MESLISPTKLTLRDFRRLAGEERTFRWDDLYLAVRRGEKSECRDTSLNRLRLWIQKLMETGVYLATYPIAMPLRALRLGLDLFRLREYVKQWQRTSTPEEKLRSALESFPWLIIVQGATYDYLLRGRNLTRVHPYAHEVILGR